MNKDAFTRWRRRHFTWPSMDRVLVALAAAVCLLFVVSLRDVVLGSAPPAMIPAPLLPASVGDRDANVRVTVVDERDAPVPRASVRVFAMREEKAYFAGEKTTAEKGVSEFKGLPRGEVWVLAYGAAMARASQRAVLVAGDRDLKLVLRVAKVLDVVVVDPKDAPMKGATVEVKGADPLPFVAVTDASGAVRLDRLGPPPYAVKVTAPAFDVALRSGVVPGPSPLRVRLEKLGALLVTVLGEDGKPASGATVLAAGSGLWPARSTETNGEGQARISGLRGGVYDLKARLADRVSMTDIGVALERGQTKEVTLKLEKGKRVRITVTDDEEVPRPVPDASVILVEEGLSSFPILGRTDKKGIVVLGPISRQRATVAARAAGFVPTPAALVEDDATEVTVKLRRGGAIAGDVVDDRGFPIPGATIEVVGSDPEGMPIDETHAVSEFRDEHFELTLPGPLPLVPMGELGVMPGPIPDLPRAGFSLPDAPKGSFEPWTTRRDGTFRAEPITPGRVQVIARHPSYVEAMSEIVTVRSGVVAKVHIVMHRGGFIEGRVLEEDRFPVAGARVELSATQGALVRTTMTADDGTFTFMAAPEEVVLSVARRENPGDIVARTIVTVPDRDRARVEIILPKLRETMRVRVVDDRGYGVDRAEVRALSLDPTVPLRKTSFSSEDGTLEIHDAVGIPLEVSVVRPGKTPSIQQLTSAPRDLRIVMAEGMRAAGEVTGRGGRERLEGAEVTLFTPSGAKRTRTNRDGAYEFADVVPGHARIAVFHKDFAPNEAIVKLEGDRRRGAKIKAIDLTRAGEVEGEVVDLDDRPVAGARVARDLAPNFLPVGPLPRGVVTTDKRGRFLLTGLPEGNVALEAYTADLGFGAVKDIEVRANRTTRRVKIQLAGEAPVRDPLGSGSLALSFREETEGGQRFVEILLVPAGGEAESVGLEPGDRLLRVNGRDVRSIDTARRLLSGTLGEDVVLLVEREGGNPLGGEGPWFVRVRRERVRR